MYNFITTKSVILISLTIVLICSQGTSLKLTTATIDDLHRALFSGEETCLSIVRGYLARIEKFNRRGPWLQAVSFVSPTVEEEARQLDRQFNATGKRNLTGSLHCVPVLVNDNIDVAKMPTTAGLRALRKMIPNIDAEAVEYLRLKGAIFLGKTTVSPLGEFDEWGNGEIGRLVRNPYSVRHTTYGSSGGNGAAGAGSFALLNLGLDSPSGMTKASSAAHLFGSRPPVVLIAQGGVFPTSMMDEVIAPMAKSVSDIAKVMDILLNELEPLYSKPDVLRKDGLANLTINVISNFESPFLIQNFLSYRPHRHVLRLFNKTLEKMASAGAIIKKIEVPAAILMKHVVKIRQMNRTFCTVEWRNFYLNNSRRFDTNARFHSVAEIVASNELPPEIQQLWKENLAHASTHQACEGYKAQYRVARGELQTDIENVFLQQGGNLAIWPALPSFPHLLDYAAETMDLSNADHSIVTNYLEIGAFADAPTLALPMGFSPPFEGAPDGLPVAAYLISDVKNMENLFRAAYSFEQLFHVPKNPHTTWELNSATKWTCCFTLILSGWIGIWWAFN